MSYPGLAALARDYGIQSAYHDVFGQRHQANPEMLLAVLRALGAPVATAADIPDALKARRAAAWREMLPPVTLARGGETSEFSVRLPSRRRDAGELTLYLEKENEPAHHWQLTELKESLSIEVDGERYVNLTGVLPRLASGYHRLVLETPSGGAESRVIAAPRLAHQPPRGQHWGVFLPLHALHRADSWGAGNYTDLAALADWTASQGGDTLATLPLLPTFLDHPFEVSPYSPVSRLMWHEFYLDLTAVPEFAACPAAQQLVASAAFQRQIKSLRAKEMVDYVRQQRLQRQVLTLLCEHFFSHDSARRTEYEEFCRQQPRVTDYARFRGAVSRRRTGWHRWPARQRNGQLEDADIDPAEMCYHSYAQWLARQQIEALAVRSQRRGVRLTMDLPLGVHAEGYDTWREREVYAARVNVGVPPDAAFTGGQDWGAPPLNPGALRRRGYDYLIECLRHHMQPAGILRLDHAMGLHRQFWIPHGASAKEGVYVRYPAEELYAVLCLESARHRVPVVGEDLGTVPRPVRPAMRRHGLRRTYVLQYSLLERKIPGPRLDIPARSIASLNTHDMPTFTGFLQGRDIDARLELKLLKPSKEPLERRRLSRIRSHLTDLAHRHGETEIDPDDIAAIGRACLKILAAGPAETLLVNLEDLWGETHFQNVPGSSAAARPNWRPRARYGLAEFAQLPEVSATLGAVNARRRSPRTSPRG